ncbi:MAG: sigma-70 family RNA polymerase sigma factor [Planctomycetes bacterium]|nr:sigma-70 family RNA polymerase sigma factor [Planctomycetota bacterium]
MKRGGATDGDWIRGLLERHERPLTLYAARLVRDVERARDVVQEAFLRLTQQERAALAGHEAVWLYKVCRNLCLDVRRKESRMSLLDTEHEEGAHSSTPPPEHAAELADSVEHVLTTMRALPAKQQEVLRLRFQSGLSYAEIAQVTEDTIGNVGWLLHEGLKGLRARLAPSEARGVEA